MWNGERRRSRDVRCGLAVRESVTPDRLCSRQFLDGVCIPFLSRLAASDPVGSEEVYNVVAL
jgi:hypothetical protein